MLSLKLSSPALADSISSIAVVATTILCVVFLDSLFGPAGTVVLRYSFDESARREERRSQFLIATVSAALGLIAGVVLDALARKLLHW